MRTISFAEAVREALFQEMELDPAVFVYGVGVPEPPIFGTTAGLRDAFGADRCFDTPISENAMTGLGFGAAIKGLRPVHVHIRVDFLLLAMNQLVNVISSYIYSTGGRAKVPLVIRAIIGRGFGQGSQHSKSLHSYFTHIPGLKVVAPTTPEDAKGLLASAIRDDNPVIYLEHRWLHFANDVVPAERYLTPFGQARILKPGRHVTLVGISWMNVEAMLAAELLARRGIELEIIDPRSLFPLDIDTIAASVKRTGHCVVADGDWLESGFSAELATQVYQRCFRDLKAPVARIGFAFTPCPTGRELENQFYPNAETIVRTVEQMLELEPADLSDVDFFSNERRFRGPF